MALPLLSTGVADDDRMTRNALLAVTYAACIAVVLSRVSFSTKKETQDAMQCVQVAVCLAGIYLHVPIAFGHVSLAYGSAMLFAPMLAFASYSEWYKSKAKAMVGLPILAVTWAPVVVLPKVFDGSMTPYMQFVYIPLHLLVTISCGLGMRAAFQRQS